ncbi:MAG: hypothetical protein V3U24_06075 [Candidatus Neomarinimicrobiota bacterium]
MLILMSFLAYRTSFVVGRSNTKKSVRQSDRRYNHTRRTSGGQGMLEKEVLRAMHRLTPLASPSAYLKFAR